MLNVENLTFAYNAKSSPTISDLNFSIKKGQVFGFLGPSGAGKTTTQKILYKLLTGYKGNISFEDKDLNLWGREYYEKIGVSFELPNHYLKLTARENLNFFSSFYKKGNRTINELLEKVDLLKDADKPVSDFSKGMKMRLNFIRSIIHDPDMLFLDEPTSGMDPVNAGKIKSLIRDLQERGKTIFITTHNMFDADQLCDEVALLHKGNTIAYDSPANLKLQFGQKTVRMETANGEKEKIFPLENLGRNEDFLTVLKNEQVRTIHSQEATLEEVFIKLTGEQLV
ncbi:MAG: ABC transporter ATP-binding protein [Candidatus Cyclobacteriaceae bacterium M2_1C_046]